MHLRRAMSVLGSLLSGGLLLGAMAVLPTGCSGKSGDPSGDGGDGGDSGNGGASGGNIGTGAAGGTVPRGSDPGSVAIRRMNATEYNNTVKDLLGTTLKPADSFPQDRYGYGFDNNASVLEVDDVQLEGYTAAAEKLATDALANAANKAKILSCAPTTGDACVKTILRTFMRRAFRRPVTDEEVARFAGLVKVATTAGDSAEVGVGLAIQGILSSPHFLFRIEYDAEPGSTKSHAVSSHEMASRLSYFLWSTMPDDELFKAADDDKLKSPDEIKAQVARMLKHEKSETFIDTFGALWTPTRLFVEHDVDTGKFKNFTPDLKAAMVEETRNMLRDVFQGKIGFREFMNSEYTYVNDQLAELYGLPKPGSATVQKVNTKGTKRAGLLTQGSFLAATSQPAITSVVKRGRYIFEKLLCGAVGDPPPGVVAKLPETTGKTVRQEFELHETKPVCAGCHKLLDPPGLVLEQYDAIGGFRTMDRDLPIDVKVDFETEEGKQTWNNAVEMAKYISTSPGYGQCVSEAVFAFALGRGPERSDGGGDMDAGVLASIQSNLDRTGWKFPDIVNAIVSSEPFRMRRAYSKGTN
jgi:hypothetical protein